MNTSQRIQFTDTTHVVCQKLSDGNPGALTVVTRLLKEGHVVDPDLGFGGPGAGVFAALMLDSIGLYGPAIWVLFKDVCGQDFTKFCAVLRAWQLGLVSDSAVRAACADSWTGARAPLNPDDLLRQVRDRLPAFGKDVA